MGFTSGIDGMYNNEVVFRLALDWFRTLEAGLYDKEAELLGRGRGLTS